MLQTTSSPSVSIAARRADADTLSELSSRRLLGHQASAMMSERCSLGIVATVLSVAAYMLTAVSQARHCERRTAGDFVCRTRTAAPDAQSPMRVHRAGTNRCDSFVV